MPGEIRAVIDIGTNSVKLLVAELNGKIVQPLFEGSEQTRLGQGFYETRILQPTAIQQTADAVAHYAEQARGYHPASIRVIATSAARDALNQSDLLAALQRASGLKAEVISGEQEAEWVFEGVATAPEFLDQPLLVMDVGGGSSEFILGRDNRPTFAKSFPLGVVRLLEKFPPRDPPSPDDLNRCVEWARTFLEQETLPILGGPLQELRGSIADKTRPLKLVGTGGTTTIMARIKYSLRGFERHLIDGATITRADAREQIRRLWSLPFSERKQIIGLPGKRADVILTGTVIFAAVMEVFGFEQLQVSARGLRYAAIMNKLPAD